jgi:hypothetical protein
MKVQVKPGLDTSDTIIVIDGKPAGLVDAFSYNVDATSLPPTVTITFVPEELKFGDTVMFSLPKFINKSNKKPRSKEA